VTRIAGLILAGGMARRMGGGDKPLLEVGGQPMIAAVIQAVGLPDIAISANGDPSRFAAFSHPVLPDGEFAGQGPLAGLLAGLHWAAGLGAEAVLTVPGDMPFLPPGIAEALLPAPAAVRVKAQLHHLVATWPISCFATLRSFLSSSRSRRVADFAQMINMHYVEFAVSTGRSFANINTVQQLERARRFAMAADVDRGEFDA
jgi:molybdopterin-guanine dinucleotide biosynthesis protein A